MRQLGSAAGDLRGLEETDGEPDAAEWCDEDTVRSFRQMAAEQTLTDASR